MFDQRGIRGTPPQQHELNFFQSSYSDFPNAQPTSSPFVSQASGLRDPSTASFAGSPFGSGGYIDELPLLEGTCAVCHCVVYGIDLL